MGSLQAGKDHGDSGDTSLPDDSSQKSTEVIRALRRAFAHGEFFGKSLSEKVFEVYLNKHDIHVSRMPIRRAIAHFEAEGILNVSPKRGTSLRPFDDRQLKAIWEDRVNLEEFIIVQLARKRRANLAAAVRTQEAMEEFAEGSEFDVPAKDDQHKFVDLDQQFHLQLAEAAGYPQLAEELNSLRFKLHIAAPIAPFQSKHRFKAICTEHDDMLKALHARGNDDKTRPDINSVRLAFLVHMRNSARDSWKIADRLRSPGEVYGPDHVLDVPDIPPIGNADELPVRSLLEMRLNIELCAISILAANPGNCVPRLELLHREVRQAAEGTANDDTPLPSDAEANFANLDLSFHSALCFHAGLLFGEEVISYCWHKTKVFRPEDYHLTGKKVRAIVVEHEFIIKALKASYGEPKHIQDAKFAIESHLFGAYLRNNFTIEMLEQAIQDGNSRLKSLKRVAKELASARTKVSR